MRNFLALGVSIASFVVVASVGAQMPSPFSAATYWPKSLEPQGAPPAQWSEAEKSLAPQDCGQCHTEQLAQWQSSRHARSISPGVLGQLLTFDAGDTAECLQCHAPLAEQRMAFEQARAGAQAGHDERLGLAAAGNSCGGCHLRLHHRFGPPERGTGAVGPGATPAAHDGVMRAQFFEQSEFCSHCHQFPADRAVNGKPLENTLVEWQASPQFLQGVTCQACHMPDRRHLWRGIHDPDTVRNGLTARTSANAERARFEISNTGVGHAFPTYVTPAIIMHAVALDGAGAPLRDTERTHVIARRVRYGNDGWTEISDTRLMPLETAAIELPWNGSDRIRVWLEVVPDDYYATAVYPDLLQTLPKDQEPSRLIAKAAADAAASKFSLFEFELRRP